ncbi:toprim domain-containing protein [uncultured Legionella sp.]|uniref:toprim domain-containing protein n=1 Tax=uncultured Legionella sp. TaxID=210934 RepID=UPI0026281E28|nr:toprim domain-containing protein [uncultured Legionella sp.]
MQDARDNFRDEMLNSGIIPPKQIIGGGRLYRFHIEGDKHHSKNGWYVFYEGSNPSGAFGNWKSGINKKWTAKNYNKMNHIERGEFNRKIEAAKKLQEECRVLAHQNAATLAKNIYYNCSPAGSSHPYLLRKCIKPFHAHQQDKRLVLPIIDLAGNIWSLQYISLNGDKRFLLNGRIAGHFIPIQYRPQSDIPILICEGFATGATLAEAYSDSCVIAACNAGNLESVALNIRKKLPSAELVICADADKVGLEKARNAAKSINGTLRIPRFLNSNPMQLTDFNDLYCMQINREIRA